MKYQNRRNGQIATLLEVSDKFHTVLLEYADGTTHSISSSTWKRWWRELEEELSEETVEEEFEMPEVNCDIQSSINSEDVAPILSNNKSEELISNTPKLDSIEKQKLQRSKFYQLVDFFNSMGSAVEYREWRKNSLAVKLGGKAFLEIRANQNGNATVYMKEDTARQHGFTYTNISNYYLPAVLKNVPIHTIITLFS